MALSPFSQETSSVGIKSPGTSNKSFKSPQIQAESSNEKVNEKLNGFNGLRLIDNLAMQTRRYQQEILVPGKINQKTFCVEGSPNPIFHYCLSPKSAIEIARTVLSSKKEYCVLISHLASGKTTALLAAKDLLGKKANVYPFYISLAEFNVSQDTFLNTVWENLCEMGGIHGKTKWRQAIRGFKEKFPNSLIQIILDDADTLIKYRASKDVEKFVTYLENYRMNIAMEYGSRIQFLLCGSPQLMLYILKIKHSYRQRERRRTYASNPDDDTQIYTRNQSTHLQLDIIDIQNLHFEIGQIEDLLYQFRSKEGLEINISGIAEMIFQMTKGHPHLVNICLDQLARFSFLGKGEIKTIEFMNWMNKDDRILKIIANKYPYVDLLKVLLKQAKLGDEKCPVAFDFAHFADKSVQYRFCVWDLVSHGFFSMDPKMYMNFLLTGTIVQELANDPKDPYYPGIPILWKMVNQYMTETGNKNRIYWPNRWIQRFEPTLKNMVERKIT
ncbi:hypothetical protein G9A89_003798 [Geosiphon pyriformis]|nr:hypothetical protein G9A89_003798 [Geosiphon pyriformis]